MDFTVQPGMEEVYAHELNVMYDTDQKETERGGRKAIIQQIDVIHKRIKNATDKYYDLVTEEQEYRAYKAKCEDEISILESKLADASKSTYNVGDMLKKAVSNLARLDSYWADFNSERKRKIISSIFPEKLSFDGSSYRTVRLNEIVGRIYLINNDLLQIKKQENEDFLHFPAQVA